MATKKYVESDEEAKQKTAQGAPRYRTSQSVGLRDDGEPFHKYSNAPEFKETSVNMPPSAYFAGAGRGKVNPNAEGKKKGGVVSSSKRADGIAQKGKTRGVMVACGGGYMKGKK